MGVGLPIHIPPLPLSPKNGVDVVWGLAEWGVVVFFSLWWLALWARPMLPKGSQGYEPVLFHEAMELCRQLDNYHQARAISNIHGQARHGTNKVRSVKEQFMYPEGLARGCA